MSFASVIGIALVVGVVVVVGIAIISYMSSLVRNAYEIKVEMRKDLDDGIKQVKAETIKQTKAARAELAGEIERSRTGILEDLKNRQNATEAALAEELKNRDEAQQELIEALYTTIEELREQVESLEGQLTSRSRLKKPAGPKEVVEKTDAEASPNTSGTNTATPEKTPAEPQQPPAENLKLASFENVTPVRKS